MGNGQLTKNQMLFTFILPDTLDINVCSKQHVHVATRLSKSPAHWLPDTAKPLLWWYYLCKRVHYVPRLHVLVVKKVKSNLQLDCCTHVHNWMAPWKNGISSTSMKLRKSLVKPVTRQNISSCSVLSPEIVMHDAFNVILWTSADICVVVHDDLGWKNRTTRYNRFCRASCSQLEYVDIRLIY